MPALFDAASQATHNGFGVNFSWSHVLGATANVIYVAVTGRACFYNATSGVTGITVGGVSMTRVLTDAGGNNAALDVYRLNNPPTGSQTIQITRASSVYSPGNFNAISVTGADTGTPDDGWVRTSVTSAGASGYSGTANVTTGAVGDLVISFIHASATFSVLTTNGTQTQRAAQNDADSSKSMAGTSAGAVGAVTHSYGLQADQAGRAAYIAMANINQTVVGATQNWRAFGCRAVLA